MLKATDQNRYQYVILNASAFVNSYGFKNVDLAINNGCIEAISTVGSIEYTNVHKYIDLNGNRLYPGFIDLQVNGCGGYTYNDDPSFELLLKMEEINHQTGTTTFLPTLVTSSKEKLEYAISQMEEYHALYLDKAKTSIPGVHLEGPFISKDKKGIHNSNYIRSCTDQDLAYLIEHKNAIGELTISPDQFSMEQIKELYAQGLNLSIGHTNLTYDQALDYIGEDHYINNATHLYNAMSMRKNARDLGVSEAIFEKNIYAGIIADLNHVHPTLIKTAANILKGHLYLVTDALASAHAPSSFKEFQFCEQQLFVNQNGYCANKDGTLGGSSLTMNIGFKNLIKYCNISEENAVEMVSSIPAKILGIDHLVGSIEVGKVANLTVLAQESYDCILTIKNGEIVYKNDLA